MSKTKLGITAGAFAAITFLAGLVNILIVVLMAGYALICENDEALRKNVLKALIFIFSFVVLRSLLGLIDNSFAIINSLVAEIINRSGTIINPISSNTILINCIAIAERLGLIILAVKAFKGQEVKLPIVEELANKSFSA